MCAPSTQMPLYRSYAVDPTCDQGKEIMRVSEGAVVAGRARARTGRFRLLGDLVLVGLADQPHDLREDGPLFHVDLYVAVAPLATAGHVPGQTTGVMEDLERHVQGQEQPFLLRDDIDEVGLGLVCDVRLQEGLGDPFLQPENLVPELFEQPRRHRTVQVRVVVPGTSLCGVSLVGFRQVLREGGPGPHPQRETGQPLSTLQDGVFVPLLQGTQAAVETQWALPETALHVPFG